MKGVEGHRPAAIRGVSPRAVMYSMVTLVNDPVLLLENGYRIDLKSSHHKKEKKRNCNHLVMDTN